MLAVVGERMAGLIACIQQEVLLVVEAGTASEKRGTVGIE
jgi:hypothetical protein